MGKMKSNRIPKEMQESTDNIIRITDNICGNSLNQEYLELCRKMIAKISRKRPSPFLYGKPEVWASAIIYCVAEINFLFDKAQKPHLTKSELFSILPGPKSTITSHKKIIWNLLGLCQLDPEFTRPSKMDDNPLVWMLEINGFITDIRMEPIEIQEIAYKRGLIPYVPGERNIK
jgi:hypothetical protein